MTIDAERLVAAIDDYKAAYGVHANRLSYVLERDDARRGAEAAKGVTEQDAERFYRVRDSNARAGGEGFPGTIAALADFLARRADDASAESDSGSHPMRMVLAPQTLDHNADFLARRAGTSAGVTVTDEMRHRAWDSWRSKGAVSNDWIRLMAALDAALAATAPVAAPQTKAWPTGCKHPNSCARHGACMYLGCVHQGFDIASQIAPAAAPEPPATTAPHDSGPAPGCGVVNRDGGAGAIAAPAPDVPDLAALCERAAEAFNGTYARLRRRPVARDRCVECPTPRPRRPPPRRGRAPAAAGGGVEGGGRVCRVGNQGSKRAPSYTAWRALADLAREMGK